MTSEELKALAEEIALCCYGWDKMGVTLEAVTAKIVPMLERVQADAWRKGREHELHYIQFEIAEYKRVAEQWMADYDALKEKYEPLVGVASGKNNQTISDQELHKISSEHIEVLNKAGYTANFTHQSSFNIGFRACERKLRSEP